MGCDQSSQRGAAVILSVEDQATATKQKRLESHLAQNLAQDFFNRDIRTMYNIDDAELGEGSFAVVKVASHKISGHKYAVKIFKIRGKLSSAQLALLKQEADIMKLLDHPNIVRLQEMYMDENRVYFVMDLATGGDMQQRLSKDRFVFKDEANAAAVIRKIFSAIGYCHARGVMHRDLKLENLLFETEDIDSEIKLVDFGLSSLIEGNTKPQCGSGDGTADYMAPEQISGKMCLVSDCWSAGVILYVLLSGHFPFYAATSDGVRIKVKCCRLRMPPQDFEHVSKEGRDFLSKLLIKDPGKRMTASEALRHPWLLKARSAVAPINEQVLKNLSRYHRKTGLERLTLEVIAHSLETHQITGLLTEFKKMDTDDTGLIGFSEFKAALIRSGLEEHQAEAIFKSLDWDKSGSITYNEFLASALDISTVSENTIRSAFDKLDAEQSGVLTVSNLKMVVGIDMTEEELKQTIAEIDNDGGGKIDYDNFRAAMRRSVSMLTGGSSSALTSSNAPLLLKESSSLSNRSLLNLAQINYAVENHLEIHIEEERFSEDRDHSEVGSALTF